MIMLKSAAIAARTSDMVQAYAAPGAPARAMSAHWGRVLSPRQRYNAGVTQDCKPLLVYDGDCDFCRTWIARWQRVCGERVDYAPYQEAAARFPKIESVRFKHAVHLIEPDGRVSQAAEAVFRSLSYRRGGGWLLWLYLRVAPFAALSEWGYSLVARHRGRLSILTR